MDNANMNTSAHSCSTCLWNDICEDANKETMNPCDYLSPIDDFKDINNVVIEDIIENGRWEFREEWFEYVEELYDD